VRASIGEVWPRTLLALVGLVACIQLAPPGCTAGRADDGDEKVGGDGGARVSIAVLYGDDDGWVFARQGGP